MSEIRTIKVKAFRCRDGSPTCASDVPKRDYCQFLLTKYFGTVDVCGITDTLINRDKDGVGWLRPVDGCPVWAEK